MRHEVRRSREALYRVAYGWCSDPQLADDLAQEAVEKALRHASEVRDPARLKGWLYRILANCLRDHFRAQRPHVDLDSVADRVFDPGPTPEEARASVELAAKVRQAVALLPLGQRQVLSLVDLEGCSYAEVGEALEIPIGTVMSRLCRARAALRERLAPFAAAELGTRLRSVK